MAMTDLDDVRATVSSIRWFHTIDLGDGIVTEGAKPADALLAEANAFLDPVDFTGLTVADIGAWNGYFSVDCRKRGAAQVTAVDDYTWSHPTFRGREAIELVDRRLNAGLRFIQVDIPGTSRESIGEHDAVLLLGVFYHLFDAQTDLLRIARCAREALILETHQDAIDEARPAMVFYPGRTLNNDETNWWGPNPALIGSLLREAGFARVHYRPHPSAGHGRGIFHAFRTPEAEARLARPSLAASLRLEHNSDGSLKGTPSWVRPPPRTLRNLVRFLRGHPLTPRG